MNINIDERNVNLSDIKRKRDMLEKAVEEKRKKQTLYSKTGKTYILTNGKINIVL